MPFEKAQANLKDHIRSSRFPPTVADIVRYDADNFTNQLQLEEATTERFALAERWERDAVDMPEHVRQRIEFGQRLLRRGVAEE